LRELKKLKEDKVVAFRGEGLGNTNWYLKVIKFLNNFQKKNPLAWARGSFIIN
jgi:hypothetical protein